MKKKGGGVAAKITVEFDLGDEEDQKDFEFLLKQGKGFLKQRLRASRIKNDLYQRKE